MNERKQILPQTKSIFYFTQVVTDSIFFLSFSNEKKIRNCEISATGTFYFARTAVA